MPPNDAFRIVRRCDVCGRPVSRRSVQTARVIRGRDSETGERRVEALFVCSEACAALAHGLGDRRPTGLPTITKWLRVGGKACVYREADNVPDEAPSAEDMLAALEDDDPVPDEAEQIDNAPRPSLDELIAAARLPAVDVAILRRRLAGESQRDIARAYGIKQPSVCYRERKATEALRAAAECGATRKWVRSRVNDAPRADIARPCQCGRWGCRGCHRRPRHATA